MRKLLTVAALALASTSISASAATLYSNPLLSGAIAAPGSIGFSAASGGGAGVLSFNLDGYNTLDGVNSYEDDFELLVNASQVLKLSYDLGGGGGNAVFVDTNGATITGGTFGFGAGGQLQISLPVSLLAGANGFTFSYSIPGPSNGDGQGTGDEAWGISNVLLTGAAAGAVPEPAAWALMIAGFGLVGGAMRRRSKVRVAYG